MLVGQKWKKTEIGLGILFILFVVVFWFVAEILEYGPVKIVRYYFLAVGLLCLAIIDLRKRIIPNRILLIMLGMRGIFLIAEAILYPEYIWNFVISIMSGSLLAMIILFIAYFIGKKGMGMGDIKMFGVIGCYMGPTAVIGTMFFSFFLAAIYSIFLLIMKRIGTKDEIPFAPFAYIGMLIAGLVGM